MISRVVLRQIRVHRETVVDFPERIGVLFGANGLGKTTVLESVYALATLKSFRCASLFEMVQDGRETGSIEAKFAGEAAHRRKMDLFARSKILLRDGVKCPKPELFLEGESVVCLAPEHQELVHGGPEGRRRYLDHLLFGLDPGFLTTSRRYHKALAQKQALLRQKPPRAVYLDLVAPWEAELVADGDEIRARRTALVAELAPRIAAFYRDLSASDVPVLATYAGPGKSVADEIAEKRDAEIYAERVLTGCHRDDLALALAERSARETASQGEKSSLLLALKMSEAEKLEEDTGRKPIVLLDDIGGTLDEERRAAVFEWLASIGNQAILTTADPHMFRSSLVHGASRIEPTLNERFFAAER